MTYASVLRRLVDCGRGGSQKNMPSSVGLERTRTVLRRLLGEDTLANLGNSVIHIVGTNGKGSVAWKTSNTLLKSNLCRKVGLYTSPHLFTVRERIRVNGELLTEDEFERLGVEVLEASANEGSSYFELVTCMALLHFSKSGCDAIVLEAGMGGRGDATNVLSTARVVALTSVAMDHVAVLGPALQDICREKIGVVKPRCRVVVGPSVDEELDPIILQTCRSQGAISVKRLLTQEPSDNSFDDENARISQACVEEYTSPNAHIIMDDTRPRCRLETVIDQRTKKQVVLDVGHNPAALERMMKLFQKHFKLDQGGLIFAIAADKDVEKCAQILLSSSPNSTWNSIALSQMSTEKGRKFADPALIAATFAGKAHSSSKIEHDMNLKSALRGLLDDPKVLFILVCGSHGLMADVLKETGNEVTSLDPFDANERGAKDPSS